MRQRILIALLLLLATCPIHAQKPKEVPLYKSDTVFVTGLIKAPLTLTLKHTEGLPVKSVKTMTWPMGKGS